MARTQNKSDVPPPAGRRGRKRLSTLVMLIGLALILGTAGSQAYYARMTALAEQEFAEQAALYSHDEGTPTPEPSPTDAVPTDGTPAPTGPDGTGTPDPTQPADPTEEPTPVPTKPASSVKYLGKLVMPKIRIETPVLIGSGPKELAVGAGYMTRTDLPGVEGGNTALAAHRRGSAAHPFARIDRLKPGDLLEFTFLDQSATLVYTVYETVIVESYETWVLEDIPGQSTMTLISCYYPLLGPKQRIVVFARLDG